MTTKSDRSGTDETVAREAWVERAVALLDHSAQNLDAATLSRLNQARQRALAPRRSPARWWLGGLAGAACALALAWGLTHRSPPGPIPAVVTGTPADIESLAGDDSLDLYEDLDFYAWLDAQRQDGNG